jgi:hypothetical protein
MRNNLNITERLYKNKQGKGSPQLNEMKMVPKMVLKQQLEPIQVQVSQEVKRVNIPT